MHRRDLRASLTASNLLPKPAPGAKPIRGIIGVTDEIFAEGFCVPEGWVPLGYDRKLQTHFYATERRPESIHLRDYAVDRGPVD